MQWSEAVLVAGINGGFCSRQGQQLRNQGLQLPLHAVTWLKHAGRIPCCPMRPAAWQNFAAATSSTHLSHVWHGHEGAVVAMQCRGWATQPTYLDGQVQGRHAPL